MYYVYVIKSSFKNYYYKGRTHNLDRRLTEHARGKTSSIKSMKTFKLVHVEICFSIDEAISLEKYFKSGFGREIIKEIDLLTG